MPGNLFLCARAVLFHILKFLDSDPAIIPRRHQPPMSSSRSTKAGEMFSTPKLFVIPA